MATTSITDYEAPYTFVLDTADFVDGAAQLSSSAIFRDGTEPLTRHPST